MKKPRTPIVRITIREPGHVNWNEQNKNFEILDSHGKISKTHLVSIGEGYARHGKGSKIVRQLITQLGGTVNPYLTEIYFDRYLGIDTSYKVSGGNFICATACLYIDQSLDHKRGLTKGDSISVLDIPRLCFLCRPGTNPERYGWMRVIDSLVRWKEFNPKFTYGIVVDSELAILPQINIRELPVFEKFFLPENISLLYASADVGRESFYNKLIKATDQVAAVSLATALRLYPNHENIIFEAERACADLTALTSRVDYTFL